MTYCRWSSDNWKCDLYCYGHVDGTWTTHVVEAAARRPIRLPHDGETFKDPTLEAFRERLLNLRQAGYHFPNYVLEEVDEDLAEQASQ